MISLAELITCVDVGIIYGIAAIGLYITFNIIDFPDLTCDGSFMAGCAVSAIMITRGMNPILASIVAFIVGGIAGCATSFLNTLCGINALLSGILVSFMLYSVNLRFMGGMPNISLINAQIVQFKTPILVAIALIVILSVCFYLTTEHGIALRAVGQNKFLSKTCGINITIMTWLGVALSNAIIAFAGSILCQYQLFADISQGQGTLIIALAAIIIGEKFVNKKYTYWIIPFCMVGSILYRFIIMLALYSDNIGIKTQDINIITGVLVVIGMRIRKKSCLL